MVKSAVASQRVVVREGEGFSSCEVSVMESRGETLPREGRGNKGGQLWMSGGISWLTAVVAE